LTVLLVSDKEKMKIWKVFLVAISIAILPFALVGVGQAQQLNCWGLRPNRSEYSEDDDASPNTSVSKREILQKTRNDLVTLLKQDDIEK
jgi:hypothetical protein